jgi:hypothetical protein
LAPSSPLRAGRHLATTVDGKTSGHGTVASKTLKQMRRLDAAYWFAPRAADH